MIINCPNCNKPINDDAKFCSDCGFELTQKNFKQKKIKNKMIKWLLILLAIQVASLIFALIIGKGSDALITIHLLSYIPTFVISVLCIINSFKCQKNKGRILGIIFTILNGLALLIIVPSLIMALNDMEPQNDKNIDTKIETKTSDKQAETTPTNWETFDCEYYGDLPIGLLKTPDATPDIVNQYINKKRNTNDAFEAKKIYNAYQSCEMEVENIFSFYNCTGTTTFIFDWNNTLTKICFEFDKNVTPSTMEKIHKDISDIIGIGCDTQYLQNKGSSTEHDTISNNSFCYCSWHLDDTTQYNAKMMSYFSNGNPLGHEFEFERKLYEEKTNYDVTKNLKKDTDTIDVNGVKITAKYHNAINPSVSGTVTNNSNKTLKFVKVKIALMDDDGKVIDTTWTYAVGAEGLAPGESTKFETYCSEAKAIKISLIN